MAATCRGLGVTLRRSKSDLFRFALTLLVLFAVSGALEAQSKPRVVTTLAGTASEGYAGDGGPALSAKFMAVSGIAIDAKGNVYVADTQNYRIRKIDPASGIITTIAGSGQVWPMGGGFSGDGGPATAALLQLPQGVGVDSAGNLYIADSNNNRVRKVDMHGKITTVAGNGYHAPGMNFPFGDGGFSGDGGPAVSARLNHPTRVCVDSQGNLFIADMANHRIRKVDRDGIITTVAGSGQTGYAGDGGLASRAQLFAPNDVAADGAGNLFIADTGNDVIRKVDTHGIITTVAGVAKLRNGAKSDNVHYAGDGGPAIFAKVRSPTGVAVDAAGNVYIADSFNDRIRMIDTKGIITTIAGTGKTYGKPLQRPAGFLGDNGDATLASVWAPEGIAVDTAGNVYFTDLYGLVRKIHY